MRNCLAQCLFICLLIWLSPMPERGSESAMTNKIAFPLAQKDGSQLHFPALLFPRNSDQMDLVSVDSLNTIMEMLLDNPSVVISLSGHCSSDEKNSDELSFNRAVTIRNYLMKKGFDSDRLVTRGLGTSSPFISDSRIKAVAGERQKEYLMAQNRRVVAAVIGIDDGRRK
jgi:outer membrane protein OmpA-like peptidoglycan-associated protein